MFILLLPGLCAFAIWFCVQLYGRTLRLSNVARRIAVLASLGHLSPQQKRIVGFFHPYCNAGGGGERVLWTAIAAMHRTAPDVVCVVYTGDVDASKDSILEKVKTRFDISLNSTALHFVFLRSRRLVEESKWPRFTLLGQSLGSMYLAWEAMTHLIPDLYIDTMGYAFTFPVVSTLGHIPVGAYVHYPTISTNMLARVKARTKWHTNADSVSSSATLSNAKLVYYRFFMYFYALSLRSAAFLMVNSSWTKHHIEAILQHTDSILSVLQVLVPIFPFLNSRGFPVARIVFPPCDTREMAKFPLEGRERIILSIAQFRPEKDHVTQLKAFHELLEQYPEEKGGHSPLKLVMLGGVRNADDVSRVEALRTLAQELHVETHVDFVVNAPYSVMLALLARASIGLSTMVDEHFGISVVEFMAAGLIPVAHASGGPLEDIIVPYNNEITGYHANNIGGFANALRTALTLPPDEELAMRRRARAWAVQAFSDQQFEKGLNDSGWQAWLEAGVQ